MNIRKPIVAGQFYPGTKSASQQLLKELLSEGQIDEKILPAKIVAGIVPHAGWVCSGAVAGKVFRAISSRGPVETVVLFGAVHRYGLSRSAIFNEGQWETPLGKVDIDQELAERILAETDLVIANPQAHEMEHSLEVQIPFIQHIFPQARILPIMTPPNDYSARAGTAIGKILRNRATSAVCIGSSDLTHYGPSYAMTSHGVGLDGVRWAKETNDAGLIRKILSMDTDGALDYAEEKMAACGAGAIAATINAAKELSASKVVVLEHTNSYEVLHNRYGDMDFDAVGYAGIVFGTE
jgi:AmmeMemoRadiSam system protein B